MYILMNIIKSYFIPCLVFVLLLDINECEDLTFNNCPENTNCQNLHGNYTCNCKAGFQENGSSCEGNNIMLENH